MSEFELGLLRQLGRILLYTSKPCRDGGAPKAITSLHSRSEWFADWPPGNRQLFPKKTNQV
jgi:hypothetical protein